MLFILSEFVIIILYGLCTEYGEGVYPGYIESDETKSLAAKDTV